LRDADVVRAMRKLGEDVLMVPMYLPLQADKIEQLTNAPIFFGGINVYLQQKLSLFRKTPRWVDWLFDRPSLLGLIAGKADMTSPRDLGETTVSMLKGLDGKQVKELERLVNWLGEEENRADVIVLSNLLLAGLAGAIKQKLNVPIVCLLKDEDGFLDSLPQLYSQQAWQLTGKCVNDMDGFIAASREYADEIAGRLGIGAERISVIDTGADGKWNAEQMIEVFRTVAERSND
jgi:hypothetical protein